MDERRSGMTNERWLGWAGAAAVWSGLWLLASALFASSGSGAQGPLQAAGVIGLSAAVAHAVIAVWNQARLRYWRLAGMALVVAVAVWPVHRVLTMLGLEQSLVQDLVNLGVISGMALAVRLAWDGAMTRRALLTEVALRESAEARLAAARSARERPGGPVAVKVGHGFAQLDPRRLAVLEAQGNFAVLSGADPSVFASESLKTLAERFAPYGFVRVHKSFVVNAAMIRSRRGEAVEMSDGRSVPVGRAYRDSLDQALT